MLSLWDNVGDVGGQTCSHILSPSPSLPHPDPAQAQAGAGRSGAMSFFNKFRKGSGTSSGGRPSRLIRWLQGCCSCCVALAVLCAAGIVGGSKPLDIAEMGKRAAAPIRLSDPRLRACRPVLNNTRHPPPSSLLLPPPFSSPLQRRRLRMMLPDSAAWRWRRPCATSRSRSTRRR